MLSWETRFRRFLKDVTHSSDSEADDVVGEVLRCVVSHVNRDWRSLLESRAVYSESRELANKVLKEK